MRDKCQGDKGAWNWRSPYIFVAVFKIKKKSTVALGQIQTSQIHIEQWPFGQSQTNYFFKPCTQDALTRDEPFLLSWHGLHAP